MSLDFAIDTALGFSVIWAAVSLPLAYLNPLKFPDDEKTTRVLVYTVGPFMFFSALFFVVNFMKSGQRGRQEERKQLKESLINLREKTDELIRNNNPGAFGLYVDAQRALESGNNKMAKIRMRQIREWHQREKPGRSSEVESMI